jgi:hypothetical protein
MMRNPITVRKGLLAGAVAGVALFVIWRRMARDSVATAPRQPVEPQEHRDQPPQFVEPEPVVVVPEPEPEPEPNFVQPEPVAVILDPEPDFVEPEPDTVQPETVAVMPAPEPDFVEPEPDSLEPEPVAVMPEPEPQFVDPEPVGQNGGPGERIRPRAALTQTAGRRDLSPAGGPRQLALAAPGGARRRPRPVSARATWPGVAGAVHLRPTPFSAATPARPIALGRPR